MQLHETVLYSHTKKFSANHGVCGAFKFCFYIQISFQVPGSAAGGVI
jgi:hypothetical protein